jgi:DNA (cytosine-5)-methyltransferase 1
MRGDSPPRREAGQGVAGAIGGGPDGGRIAGNVSSKWAKGTGGPAGDEAYNLVAHPYTLAIRGRGESHDLEFRQDGTANAVLTPNGGRAGIGVGAIAQGWAVRRLTPLECERLQGFPDGWTAINRRNGKPAADGPRYKALGNSMAVNVMRWIGQRIEIAGRCL